MNKFLIILIMLAALATGIGFYITTNQQPGFGNSVLKYEQSRPIMPFTLIDNKNSQFTNDELMGHWSLVFFGYTSCPDVCPTTLQELNFIYPELKSISPAIQVLLISVDPKRDSVEKLSNYIGYFNSEFIALRAEHDVLYPFARNLGLMYAIGGDTTDDNYLVDHSASLVLVDPNGQISAIFKPEIAIGEIAKVNSDIIIASFKHIVSKF